MQYIAQALRTLLPNRCWRMNATPMNEQEFIQYFEVVTHFDEGQNAVYSANPADFGVTWAQVEAEVESIKAQANSGAQA